MWLIPKIIENLRESILTQARKDLFESGYAGLNMRKIALLCKSATGTVYNYFPSKDILVANIVLEDWQKTTAEIADEIAQCQDVDTGLLSVYSLILSFNNLYRKIFDESSLTPFNFSYSEKHLLLREQISGFIRTVLEKNNVKSNAFIPVFLAESFLTGSTQQWSFDDLLPIINKLIKGETL